LLASIFTFVEGTIAWTASGQVTWALNCDWTGGDIGSQLTTGDQCGGACQARSGCDHFTWTSFNGGTCWFKHFTNNPSAVETSSGVCGYLPSGSSTTTTTAPPATTKSPTGLSIVFVNKCTKAVAMGAQNVPGFSARTLNPGQSWTLPVPTTWSTGGTVWGCYTDNSKCNTNAPEPPISVIELHALSGQVWYDTSYVSGYNIPIGLFPNNNCPALSCPTFDYTGVPDELIWKENGKNVGVFSVCKAAYDSVRSAWFKSRWGANYDKFGQLVCCAGPYDTKATCDGTPWPKASNGADYVKILDSKCASAYAYPYDDQKALQHCTAPQYSFQFCPSTSKDESGSTLSATPTSVWIPALFLFLYNLV